MNKDLSLFINTLFKKKWIQILLVTVAYYIAAGIGQLLALPHGFVTPIWPPSGIALAAVLLFGNEVLAGVFLGSFFHGFFSTELADIFFAKKIALLTGIGIGASLQTYVAAYFIRKYTHSRPLDTVEGVLKFTIISILSCLINATISGSLVSLIRTTVPWHQIWWTWWIGDSTGVLIVTPLILSWRYYKCHFATPSKILQAFVVFLLILIFSQAIFESYVDLTYALISLTIWIGFSFYQKGVTSAIAFITGLVIWHTIQGLGPFFIPDSLNTSLLSLDLFFIILTFSSLLIVAALTEREHAKYQLEHSNLELEKKVKERTQKLEIQVQQLREMQQHIINKEKLASLGTLIAGVAHEIKNPLNFIANFSELSLKFTEEIKADLESEKEKLSKDKLESIIDNLNFIELNTSKVIDHTKRANYTIEDMLRQAKDKPKQLEETNLNQVIKEYVKLVYQSRRKANTDFNVHIEHKLDLNIPSIATNQQNISRVLINLLNNAFDSMEEKQQRLGPSYKPTLIISTKNHPHEVEIDVYDNGVGIPKEIKDKIFLPFFTNKAEKGTGLGLYISYEIIVKEHQGFLEFESQEGEYTVFILRLPKDLSE